MLCTTTLPGGSGQCNSCNAVPHCLGAVGNATRAMHCYTAWGSGRCNSCNARLHCPGAVGGGTPDMHCHIARGQWAVEEEEEEERLPRSHVR